MSHYRPRALTPNPRRVARDAYLSASVANRVTDWFMKAPPSIALTCAISAGFRRPVSRQTRPPAQTAIPKPPMQFEAGSVLTLCSRRGNY